MSKYECYDCGFLFDAPERVPVTETGEFWGARFVHTTVEERCPNCDSGEIGSPGSCRWCGQRPAADGDELCGGCRARVDAVRERTAAALNATLRDIGMTPDEMRTRGMA